MSFLCSSEILLNIKKHYKNITPDILFTNMTKFKWKIDRVIRLTHLRNRHVTDTETALTTVGNHYRHIQPKTMRNRLREFGLRARRPYIGFPLTRARRMAWLAAHGPRQ